MKKYRSQTQILHLDPALGDFRLRDFEIFLAAAQLRSFRLAARSLRIEPSQVSRATKAFEKRIQKKLFLRSAAGVSLTPAGVRFQQIAQKILNQSIYLKEASQVLPLEPTFYGIASANYLVQNLLPECLVELERKRPGIRFRLIELFPDEMLLPGLRGAFDICLHAGPIDWPGSWHSQTVGSIEWGFFVNAQHPLVKDLKKTSKVCDEEMLKDFPFVTPFDFSIVDGFRFRDDKSPITLFSRRSGYELQRADVAIEIIKRTTQIAHLPSIVSLKYLENGTLKYLQLAKTPPVQVPLILSVQASTVSSKTTRLLFEILKTHLDQTTQTFQKMRSK